MALFPDLSARVLQPELMDDPALDAAEHARALRGLRLVNRASATPASLWQRLLPLARGASKQAPFRVLDVACGSGDVALGLVRLAARDGVAIEAHACDISPRALAIAADFTAGVQGTGGVVVSPAAVGSGAEKAAAESPVRFFHLDAIRDAVPGEYDAVMCSLFMHHLTPDDAVTVLSRMKAAARRAVLVSDLRRCLSGYLLAYASTRLCTTSRIVRTDALLSVRAAFTPREFGELASRAGMAEATIERAWPSRFIMEWRRG